MNVFDRLVSASNIIAKQKQELSSNLSNRWHAVSERIVMLKSDYGLDNLIPFPIKHPPIGEEAQKVYNALRAQIGAEPRVGEWFEISQSQIDQFAAVTRDEQWIHVDMERAKRESPYRSTIAHGFLILSMIPHLVPEQDIENIIGYPPRMLLNSGLTNVRFIRPVKPGTKIRARREYVAVQVLRKGFRITDRVTIETSPDRPVTSADVIYILSL